jgi:hypothetical protein
MRQSRPVVADALNGKAILQPESHKQQRHLLTHRTCQAPASPWALLLPLP